MIWRATAIVCAVVAAVLAWRLVAIWRQPPPPPPPSVHLHFQPPPGAILGAGEDTLDAVVSPAGDEVVFVATTAGSARLWRRPLAAATATPIPGTEGASAPAWVNGQRAVSFFAGTSLKVVALDTRRRHARGDGPGGPCRCGLARRRFSAGRSACAARWTAGGTASRCRSRTSNPVTPGIGFRRAWT